MATADRHGCLRRLARDLREVQTSPLPTIAAAPHGDDLQVWRVTFTAPDGPYRGVPFHMVINFPATYPRDPPRVQLCTFICHPNVFEGYDYSAGKSEPGVWLCLNMLRSASHGSYSGWSGAYSVYSILVQLQSFLFAENIDQDYGYAEAFEGYCNDTVDQAHRFHKKHGDEFPALAAVQPEDSERAGIRQLRLSDFVVHNSSTSSTSNDRGVNLVSLPEDLLVKVADNLPPEAISALFRTCKAAAGTLSRAQLAARRELVCFYSKVRFTETVLGFGLSVELGRRYPRGAGRHIKSIRTELELLSHESFEQAGVRTSVWQQPFNQWLPVLLDADHSNKSLPLAQKQLMVIAGYPQTTLFDPMVALTVLPRLLNQMTVSLMSVNNSTSLHASEKALLGFTSFHHLLLKLASEYPAIQQRAQFWVHEFMRSPGRRSKLVIHDLGEFLVLLYLCPSGTWDQLASMFLTESLVRKVRWLLDPQHGDAGVLAVLEPDGSVSDYRLKQTLQSSGTSMRLLMFQVFFLREVACPAGATPDQLLQKYETSLGRPPPGTASKLQTACKKILNELSWPFFLETIGITLTRSQVCDALRAAVRTSEERGYHSTKNVDWSRLRQQRAIVDGAFGGEASATVHSDAASSVSERSSGALQCFSQNITARPFSTPQLFVAGLLPTQTEAQLRQLCCSFGHPAAVQKHPGSKSAFIWFCKDDEADAALAYLREVTVCGRPLRVERARGGRRCDASVRTNACRRQPSTNKVEKCPYPPQSLAAKKWYKEQRRY